MSRSRARLRSRLCGVIVMATIGSAVAPELPTDAAANDGAVGETIVPPEASFREQGSERPRASVCPDSPEQAFDPSVADAPWERRIMRAVGAHSVGVAVGTRGRIAFEVHGAKGRVPASNQKLLLSLAMFDRLGPDHRIPTRAVTGRVKDETVPGDLWLIGGGDPSLTAAEPGYWGTFQATTLAALAERIKRSGISRVDGRVRGALGYFAHDFDAPGWQPYVPRQYLQLPSALVLNGNHVAGAHPERFAAAALTKQLEKAGVTVLGAPGMGAPPAHLTTVARVRSRPLREVIAFMNRSSNNFFAEVFGKLLGAEVYGRPGTIAKGARAIEAWVRDNGERAVARDSSGLSYRNRISPRSVVRLLSVAETRPWIGDLRRGLPSAGEGTLRYRLAGLDVRAKTGSLFNGASTLSGWVRSRRTGRWVAFSILGNDVPTAIVDRIVGIVSRARARVPARSLRRACPDDKPNRGGRDTASSAHATAATYSSIRWRRSIALGTHSSGRLINGVQLPAEGRHFFTWNPVRKSSPNRGNRRFGTARLLRVVISVLDGYRDQHPEAARVGIGDISRPNGGDFGEQFGGLGHSSHQNGLDVDIYYPRRDGRERAPRAAAGIERVLAQDLVDRFVRAGAQYVFVGPNTGLTGPPHIVQPLAHHDDHLHVRLRDRV
jgi:D-alanyl-D-alanine carboxypeptidase